MTPTAGRHNLSTLHRHPPPPHPRHPETAGRGRSFRLLNNSRGLWSCLAGGRGQRGGEGVNNRSDSSCWPRPLLKDSVWLIRFFKMDQFLISRASDGTRLARLPPLGLVMFTPPPAVTVCRGRGRSRLGGGKGGWLLIGPAGYSLCCTVRRFLCLSGSCNTSTDL